MKINAVDVVNTLLVQILSWLKKQSTFISCKQTKLLQYEQSLDFYIQLVVFSMHHLYYISYLLLLLSRQNNHSGSFLQLTSKTFEVHISFFSSLFLFGNVVLVLKHEGQFSFVTWFYLSSVRNLLISV